MCSCGYKAVYSIFILTTVQLRFNLNEGDIIDIIDMVHAVFDLENDTNIGIF